MFSYSELKPYSFKMFKVPEWLLFEKTDFSLDSFFKLWRAFFQEFRHRIMKFNCVFIRI